MLQRRIFFYPYFPSQLRSLIKVDLCERAYLTGIYNSTPLLTYNLAHGGATVSRSVLEPLFGLTHTFHEQIDDIWMRRYAFSSNPADSFPPKHRIFILFFGVVDISLLARRVAQGETDVARGEAVLEAVIEALEEGMRKLYTNGARIFLLINIPPLNLAPVIPTFDNTPTTDPSVLEYFTGLFNKRLKGLLYSFRRSGDHLGARLRLFDLNAFLNMVIHRPREFEQTKSLKETKINCWEYNPDMPENSNQPWDFKHPACPHARNEYLWANGLHVTHPVQDVIAFQIVKDCFAQDARKGQYCL